MLPHGFEQPTAVALLIGGALACFAGYRLFRIVLGIYGFILGAMIASSVVGVTNTTGMLLTAVIGGLAGSVVLVFAWFVGVSLVGAGLGVLAAHVAWMEIGRGDPPAIAIIAVAIAGAVGAMFVQKYVIVMGTAFGGAWTIVLALVNGFPAAKEALARGSSDADVWIFYPTSSSGLRWAPIIWLGLGVLGTAIQLSTAAGKKK